MNSVTLLNLMLLPLLLSVPTWAQSVSGVMMVVKGDIKVTSADGKTENGKVGKKVSQGDTIISGTNGRAKVVMSDKNVINVSPDTKIKIEKYSSDGKDKKEVELNVVYGKVRASVEQKYDGDKSKFNIKTPSAVAGVRGTDFITGYNPTTKVSQVITFAGTVAVGTPGPNGSIQNPVFVQPGQMTEAGSGKAPEAPKPVPPEQLNQLNTESKADMASSKQDDPQKEAKKDSKNEKKEEDKKEPKKDGKKDETKAGPKKEPGSEPGTTESARNPANEPAPSMFDPSKDNPGSTGNLVIPIGPGSFTNFPPPIIAAPLPNQFIGDAIRNGQNVKTTIILNPQ